MKRSRNHSAYDTHYHIVFSVKYRLNILNRQITQAIQTIAIEIGGRYDIEFEKIGCDGDHIHMLVSFAPKYSGSDVVRIFKSITAKKLFKQFPELRQRLWKGEFWSDGFYFATVGERGNVDTVRRYVEDQGGRGKNRKTVDTPLQLRLPYSAALPRSS